MTSNRRTQQSANTRRRIEIPDLVTTVNNTPTVVFSIPMPASTAFFIQVTTVCSKSDYSNATMIIGQTVFRRPSIGNIIRCATPNITSGGDFSGIQPQLDLIANTSSQTIDVTITGKLSTNLNWQFQNITILNV